MGRLMSDPRVRIWDEHWNEIHLSIEERKALFGLIETGQEADE
jgi:hypothetical protein